ncbi:tyrosine-type recombinase/integrase [Actinomycetota bacterium]
MSDDKKIIIRLIEGDLSRADKLFLSKMHYDLQKHISDPASGRSLETISKEEIISDFINHHNSIRSKNTKCNYWSVLKDLLEYCYPDIIDRKVLDYIKNKEWKPNTMRRNLIVIRRFLKFLYEKGQIINDLTNIIKIPQKVITTEFCPNEEQLKRLFSCIENVFLEDREVILYRNIFKLYAKTGMRRTELLNLDVEDVNFDDKKIILKKTKNGDERVIVIDSILEELLKDYLNYFKYEHGPLFRGKRDKRLTRQRLALDFKYMKEQAGLPLKLRIHSFRRYFINTLRKNRVDLVVIAQLVGHRDIRTTRGYCNVGDDEMVNAMETVRV